MLLTGYRILGLKRGATPAEVKRAFKRLAREYHPDKNPNNYLAEEKFKLLCRAFEIAYSDAEIGGRTQSGLSGKGQIRPINCRRMRRGSRADRRYGWQFIESFVGTRVSVVA